MIKFFQTCLTVLLSTTCMFAQQSMAPWFIPSGNIHMHSYYIQSESTGKAVDGYLRTKEYVRFGNGNYGVKDRNYIDGKIVSISAQNITITNNEVQVTRTVKMDVTERQTDQIYEPASITVKLPTNNEKVTWLRSETGKECFAFFKVMKRNGSNVKLLAVHSVDDSDIKKVINVSYYQYGIGLVMTSFIVDGKETIFSFLGE